MRDGLGAVQSALVFGGTSDIAEATLRRLVERRTRRIVLAGRDVDRLGEIAEDLRARGATLVECVPFDALDTTTHEAVVDDVFDRVGDIDLVLVAFGVLGEQADAEQRAAAAVDVARVNYLGAVSVLTPTAERLRSQGHGAIVVLSSVAGERARESNYVYGSTKAGLDAFAQGLSDRLAGTGVSVMIVRPGFVHTKMTTGLKPAPLAATPEAVAEAICDGLASGRTIVWVPGALRPVMSVLRHLPRPVFRRLAL
ncbi:MAG TPA: decaprenylphospho-beta-D-erythro-pentofuranosid-2-ulose 2-reductase [Acidimicrobiia bacterium]|nr:decaprenylphospho-beta-D-erythro-pentofuranosid-2-ulose 2-reductase [Acidimicrobiia bacterium]